MKKLFSAQFLVAAFIFISIAFSIFVSISAIAKEPAVVFDHSHQLFDTVLKTYAVTNTHTTFVEYASLKKNPENLISYLKQAAKVTRADFDKWTREQQMAYLINYYNANTLKWVIDHYPTKSIKKTVPWYKSVFKNKFYPLFGKNSSLEDLEHGILRPDYREPLIHFGANCAAIGCPSLLGEAFVADQLFSQLKKNAKRFLTDKTRSRIDTKKKIIYASELFDWFEEDFTNSGMTFQIFVSDYITDDPAIKKDLLEKKYKIKYLDYDWKLNDKK